MVQVLVLAKDKRCMMGREVRTRSAEWGRISGRGTGIATVVSRHTILDFISTSTASNLEASLPHD